MADEESLISFGEITQRARKTELEVTPYGKRPKRINGLECQHYKILVNSELAEVECGDCGAHLNPMVVLERLARRESRLADRIKGMQEERERWEKQSKTKCVHCGKFTHLR